MFKSTVARGSSLIARGVVDFPPTLPLASMALIAPMAPVAPMVLVPVARLPFARMAPVAPMAPVALSNGIFFEAG